MNSEVQKIKNDDKVTNISEEKNKKNDMEIGVKHQLIPLINYKLNPILSSSILNYIFIGISFPIFGCIKLKYLKLNENLKFCSKYYLITGIVLYITGILDWYDGKDILYLVDFILSFYFICLNIIEDNEYFKIATGENAENEKLRGTFYLTLFLFFLCIAIAYKNKGKFYLVVQSSLVIGYIFLFLYKYFENEWMEKIYSFAFIIIGCLFWLTGLFKMIDNLLSSKTLIFLYPSD